MLYGNFLKLLKVTIKRCNNKLQDKKKFNDKSSMKVLRINFIILQNFTLK